MEAEKVQIILKQVAQLSNLEPGLKTRQSGLKACAFTSLCVSQERSGEALPGEVRAVVFRAAGRSSKMRTGKYPKLLDKL